MGKKTKENDRFVTGAELARLAGCSGPYITKCTASGKLQKTGNGRYDLKDELTLLFLEERSVRASIDAGTSAAIEELGTEDIPAIGAGKLRGMKSSIPFDETYTISGLSLEKLRVQVRLLKIEEAEKYKALVSRSIVETLMGALSQSIRVSFIDVQNKWTDHICHLCDALPKVREVREYLENEIRHGLESCQMAILNTKEAMNKDSLERRKKKEEGIEENEAH